MNLLAGLVKLCTLKFSGFHQKKKKGKKGERIQSSDVNAGTEVLILIFYL